MKDTDCIHHNICEIRRFPVNNSRCPYECAHYKLKESYNTGLLYKEIYNVIGNAMNGFNNDQSIAIKQVLLLEFWKVEKELTE